MVNHLLSPWSAASLQAPTNLMTSPAGLLYISHTYRWLTHYFGSFLAAQTDFKLWFSFLEHKVGFLPLPVKETSVILWPSFRRATGPSSKRWEKAGKRLWPRAWADRGPFPTGLLELDLFCSSSSLHGPFQWEVVAHHRTTVVMLHTPGREDNKN